MQDPVGRIIIVGAGGVGGYAAVRLAAAGRDVGVVARGPHLEAIRAHGLRLESILGDAQVGIRASADPSELGPAELIVVCVKTWQIDDAADAIAPLVGPQTTVLPIQNGVEAADRLARRLRDDAVIGGSARIISFVDTPGTIRHVGGPARLEFGERDGSTSERVERVRDLLDVPGLDVVISADIRIALWEKMVFVVPFGSVGAVTRAPIGVTRSMPETRMLLDRAMHEIVEVAAARGVLVEPATIARAWSFVDSLPAAGTASLQRDIAAGVPSELDDWCGAVHRIGRECGVETPVHSFIYASLLPQERNARNFTSSA